MTASTGARSLMLTGRSSTRKAPSEVVAEELHEKVEAPVESEELVELEEPVEEPASALPAETEEVEAAPAEECDLSALDGDEDDYDSFRDVE